MRNLHNSLTDKHVVEDLNDRPVSVYVFINSRVDAFTFTIRGVGEGVVNDGVQGAGPSGGGNSRESWHQTGKDEKLLLSTVVPQGLQPQQEETDPLTADLDKRRMG